MPIPDHLAHPHLDRAAQDAAFDRHRSALTVALWDRTSPINGVAADHFLGRPDVRDEGAIYLIQQDGHTLIFQPHHPQGGPMVNGEHDQVAADHIDQIAANRAIEEVMGPQPPVASPGGPPAR